MGAIKISEKACAPLQFVALSIACDSKGASLPDDGADQTSDAIGSRNDLNIASSILSSLMIPSVPGDGVPAAPDQQFEPVSHPSDGAQEVLINLPLAPVVKMVLVSKVTSNISSVPLCLEFGNGCLVAFAECQADATDTFSVVE